MLSLNSIFEHTIELFVFHSRGHNFKCMLHSKQVYLTSNNAHSSMTASQATAMMQIFYAFDISKLLMGN